MKALRLFTYQGMGDAVHARSVLPQLMVDREVWIETRWPQVFHDLPGLHIGHDGCPQDAHAMTAGYHPNYVKAEGSILAAMARGCGVPAGDFRLPVRNEWCEKAVSFLRQSGWDGEPIAVCRSLVEVSSSIDRSAQSKVARNPDSDAYVKLFSEVRRGYFVVTVANCRPGTEWRIGPNIDADVDCTDGRLDFETLAGLFGLADLVYCHPGFAAVLAQAVGVPSICVFGGFEDARSFAGGADYAPWLPIEPIDPCPCWSPECSGKKTIDMPAAIKRVRKFMAELR